ncbi:MAG: Fur family transcriptional regulator [Bdellovibrionales bacterium]
MATHRHTSYASNVQNKIERYLRKQGGRMTGVRHEIVSVMAALDGPKTAYQILESANKKRKSKLSAISVYRTLDFLTKAGAALKFESQNAYELCLCDKSEHSHLMMICDKCGHIREIEAPELSKTLSKTAKDHGHRLKHHVIELHGICSSC